MVYYPLFSRDYTGEEKYQIAYNCIEGYIEMHKETFPSGLNLKEVKELSDGKYLAILENPMGVTFEVTFGINFDDQLVSTIMFEGDNAPTPVLSEGKSLRGVVTVPEGVSIDQALRAWIDWVSLRLNIKPSFEDLDPPVHTASGTYYQVILEHKIPSIHEGVKLANAAKETRVRLAYILYWDPKSRTLTHDEPYAVSVRYARESMKAKALHTWLLDKLDEFQGFKTHRTNDPDIFVVELSDSGTTDPDQKYYVIKISENYEVDYLVDNLLTLELIKKGLGLELRD